MSSEWSSNPVSIRGRKIRYVCMFGVYMISNPTSFSNFEQYLFPASFRKELLQCGALLSNTPSWFFLQYHQSYLMPPMPPTLAHRPLYPNWRTIRVTHAGMSTTLAHHQRKHTTFASRPPTQARHLAQIAWHFSNSWVTN